MSDLVCVDSLADDGDDDAASDELKAAAYFESNQALSADLETPNWINGSSLIPKYLESCPTEWSDALREFVVRKDTFSPSQLSTMASSLSEHNAKFRLNEVQISSRNEHHLISSSGSLVAPILIKLHYPSFTTSHKDDGETADYSSPCPRLLLNAGFTSGNAFWMQAYYRRELPEASRKSPMRKWSPKLLQIHEEHSDWHEEHSMARFRLLLGSHNRKNDLKKQDTVSFLSKFPEDITIRTSLHVNKGTIHHITFYTHHPEDLFQNPSRRVSLKYDICLGLVAALADLPGFQYGSFAMRAQYLQQKGITGRALGDNALHDAIQLLATERSEGKLLPLDEIPSSIKNWLVAQGTSIDELQALPDNQRSIVELCHQKMVSKGGVVKAKLEKSRGMEMPSGLDKIRDANRDKDSQIQRYQATSSTVTSVRVHCAKCKSSESAFDDTKPTFEKQSGKYISRKRSSCKQCCTTYTTKAGTTRKRDVDFIPVDTSTSFVYARNISAKK